MTDSRTQTKIMMDRAKSAVLSRDYTLAARLYRGLLQSDPQNIELLSALGNLYERSGKDRDSIPLFKEVVRLDPENINALNELGAIYRRLKQYDQSIAMLEQAVIVDEKNSQVFYNLGFTYKLMAKYDDAVECFNSVVESNPNDVLAYNHLGTIYELQGKHDMAVAAFQRGLKVDPNHPILHLNLAKSYEAMGNDVKAFQEYESALRYKPGWLDAIDGYADLLLKKNKTKDARDVVQQAIRLNPENVKMHTKMGTVYSRQNDFDSAEKEYNSALEKEPENRNALSGLASAYESDGKNLEAIHTMKKLEKLYPDDSDTLKQFAHVLLTANKINSASKKIKAVWDMDPEDVQTLNLLGQYYICRGEEAKALGCYKKIEAINPHYKDYYRDGAKRYNQTGFYDKAMEYCQQFLRTNPDDTDALYTLAKNFEKQNRYAEALSYYNKLSNEDNSNAAYKKGIERSSENLTRIGEGAAPVQEENPAYKSIDENEAVDENIAPVEINEEDPVESPAAEEKDIEQQLKEKYDDSFSFSSLTEDSTDENNVFNKLDDEIQADETDDEESDDLDALLDEDPGDEGSFFHGGNSGGMTDGPREESFEPQFESEDIDGGLQKNSDDALEVTDGLDEDFEEDEEEAVPDNAFSDEGFDFDSPDVNGGRTEPENNAPSHKPSAENHEPDIESEPEPAPEAPEFENAGNRNGEERQEEMPEIPSAYNPPIESDFPEPQWPEENINGETSEPEIPEAEETAEVTDEETVPETESEPEISETPEAGENGSEPEESHEPEIEAQPETEEELPEAFEDTGLSGLAEQDPESDELEFTDPSAEDGIAATEVPAVEEENISPEEMNAESDAVPDSDFDDEVSNEPEPVFEEVPEVQNEEPASEENDLEFTEPESICAESETAGETEEPSVNVTEENSVPEEMAEENTEPELNTEPDISGKETKAEEVIARAASTLNSVVEAISDRKTAEKFTPAAQLFIELRELANYLPPEKRNLFLKSREHIQLEFIIARLTGKPGLLATAQALRDQWQIADKNEEIRTGNDLMEAVLLDLNALVQSLPDRSMTRDLENKISSALEILNEE